MSAPLIWLASYPRSGNTFLRTILFQCLGLRSASIYPRDIKAPELAATIGHLEHRDGAIDFGDAPIRLLKTHAPPQDDRPAIYVVRNGLDAVRSLYDFWAGGVPVEKIILGHRFGSWAGHLIRWNPKERPNTLLLRYEDMRADVPATVRLLSDYLSVPATATNIPPRQQLVDGKWVNGDKQRAPLTPLQMSLFKAKNAETMKAYGYEIG